MPGPGRTPLFQTVRRAMRQAHREEVLLSRRDVVKTACYGALALTGIGALATPAKAQGAAPKIAIVGAGIAGLRAALRLQDEGYAATVYEGSDRVGGRIRTIRDAMGPGLTTEAGGEFIDSGHREMLTLARRFGLRLVDIGVPSEAALTKTIFVGDRFRSEAEIAAAFRPLARRIASDQELVEYESYASFNRRALYLDRKPLNTYLREIGAQGWIYELLDVAYATEYGLDTTQQSALNLVFLIGTDLSEGFQEFGESDQRYKIAGGNDLLTTAIANTLTAPVQAGSVLRRVVKEGTGYRLSFDRPGGAPFEATADFVLLTLPLTTLRDVDLQIPLTDTQTQAIQRVTYGTNAKLVLGFDRRYWRDAGANGLFFTDLPIQSGWDSSQRQPGTAGSLTVFKGGREGVVLANGTVADQRLRALRNVQAVFPGATRYANDRVLRIDWPNDPWAKGSYTCFGPGGYTQYGGAFDLPAERVYFAGEHCSIDYQGYMEGGAVTGRNAAARMVGALRRA